MCTATTWKLRYSVKKKHMIFNATNDLKSFALAHNDNQDIGAENQCRNERSSSNINDFLTKETDTVKPPVREQDLYTNKSLIKKNISQCYLFNTEEISENILQKISIIVLYSNHFHIKNLRTFYPTKKSCFDKKFQVACGIKVTCSKYNSIYVGQTHRYDTTISSGRKRKIHR